MSPRLYRRVAKTKTFSGCWTCRRRKVKCDNRRPQCHRCGQSCEGYDVDLYWMEEGRERPCTVKRKAMLIQDPRLPLKIDLTVLDDMLDKLDAIVDEAGAGAIGAFSAFAIDEYDMSDASTEGSSEQNPAGMPSESLGLELATIASEMPLYIDTDVAELMDNYINVVADLLQPASHTQNPYRSIYVPRAMEAAASGWVVGVGGTSSRGGTALFHALLAVSAFHMHQNQPKVPRYQRLGRLHRLKAVESLQKSLAEGESAADYHTTMSAMLSMVSIDLMEGSMTEFWIHLEGCEQLRLSLQNSQLGSSRHDQLFTICSFMSTLSRSTNPYLEPKSWREQSSVLMDDLLRTSPFLPDNHSLEFTYGTTATLASYMNLTILLSQHLTYYEIHNLPLPMSLEEACSALNQALLTWSITDESLCSVPDRDYQTLSLVSCHILAFHAAVVIYFHTLTPFRSTSVLRHYNKICVSNLLAAEALKSSQSSEIGWNAMAPIVWPGFIAACEAEREERPLWRAWWIGVQRYCIGSIHTLWDVVQQVWEEENQDERGPRWKAVLGRKGRRVMSGG